MTFGSPRGGVNVLPYYEIDRVHSITTVSSTYAYVHAHMWLGELEWLLQRRNENGQLDHKCGKFLGTCFQVTVLLSVQHKYFSLYSEKSLEGLKLKNVTSVSQEDI